MIKRKSNYKKIGMGVAAIVMTASMAIPTAFNGFSVASAENGFNSETSASAMLNATKKTNLKIAEESAVLLKNNNNALPLNVSDKTKTLERDITVFHSISNSIVGYFGKNENYMLSALHAFTHFAGNENPTTIYESLENNNFNFNPGMKKLYDKYSYYTDNNESQYGIHTRTGPNVDVISSAERSFANYNDAAVITISRVGCEGYDGLRLQDPNEGLHVFDAKPGERYLSLNKGEKELLKYVKGKFKKVVVLVNAPMPLEMSELQDDDGVDAIMWIGYPGWNGFEAIGELLSGAVNPSGRLVDTWAADVSKDPTWYNYYNNSQTSADGTPNYSVLDPSGKKTKYVSIDYSEGIYLGYKFYETAATEGYFAATKPATTPANYLPAGVTDDYYNRYNGVVYPFGYGLSYTNFTQEIVAGSTDTEGDTISLDVKVTNNGDVAGKEVVQVYYNPCYKDGEIEKASANLAAFAKTKELKKGESEIVTLSFDKRDMASYDYNDANKDGHKGYELEAGAYEISLKKNSHEVWGNHKFTYTHATQTNYDTDSNSGKNIEQLFSGDNYYNTDRSKYTEDGSGIKVMTRATKEIDGKKTIGFVHSFPQTAGNVTFSAEAIKLLDMQEESYTSTSDSATDKYLGSMYKESVPASWTQESDPAANRVNGWNTRIMLSDMKGIDYMGTTPLNPDDLTATGKTAFKKADGTYMTGEEAWAEFMNLLTWDEMATLASDANFSTPAIDAIGKPRTVDNDGPAQIGTQTQSCMNFACGTNIASTWNVDLVNEYGKLIGDHAINQGITGWYGPGLNIHRNPYGGRNYEYYSEDAVLTGRIASAAISGAASKGVVTYMKHFALNNQEENRHGVLTWADEQTMREIYLKGFEIAVKDGGATGVMCSFNAIGGIGACMNNHLTVKLLTEEWGFRGAIITDAYGDSGWPSGLIVRCQTAPLGKYSSNVEGTWNATKNLPEVRTRVDGETVMVGSATHYYAVRMTAQRMLYSVVNSNGMKVVEINPEWSAKYLKDINLTYKQGEGGGGYTYLGFGTNDGPDDRLKHIDTMTIEGDGMTSSSWGAEWKQILPGFHMHKMGDSFVDTPVAGEWHFTLTATKGYLRETHNFNITVISAFKDKTFSGTQGVDFNGQIELVDGSAISAINSCSAEGLPEGLSVTNTGAIVGKAAQSGTFNVKFIVNGKYEWNSTITLAEKTTHTVTFDGNGADTTTTVEVAPNGKVTAPETAPEREGYTFVGWCEDAAGNTAANFDAAVTGAKTYYAKWKELKPEFKVEDGVLKYTPDGKTWLNVANIDDLKGEDGANGSNGVDGQTPTINDDGYWVINGVVTQYKAVADSNSTGGGCSGNIAGTCLTAGAALMLAGAAAVALNRKRKNK